MLARTAPLPHARAHPFTPGPHASSPCRAMRLIPMQLFPEGWDEMDGPTKAYQLYMGKRGALFWMSQLAWYGSITLGVAWALFRWGGWGLLVFRCGGGCLCGRCSGGEGGACPWSFECGRGSRVRVRMCAHACGWVAGWADAHWGK